MPYLAFHVPYINSIRGMGIKVKVIKVNLLFESVKRKSKLPGRLITLNVLCFQHLYPEIMFAWTLFCLCLILMDDFALD